jgi:hypothetical protein
MEIVPEKPVSVGDGGIRVLPIAFESFGVRSMCTWVETDDVKILIDPGSALGPRFNLPPHEREYMALARSRERIVEMARKADVLTISHYHFDHYVPNFENWAYTWSSPELANRLYRGKLILAKDMNSDINASQRKRGYMFQKLNSKIAREIKTADGQSFKFGDTELQFSKPVFHGAEGSRLGYVLMLTVRAGNCEVIHAPDVQGPMSQKTFELISSQNPDLLLIGGPPIYLKNFKVSEEDLIEARNNLEKIVEKIPLTIIDHHLLRSLDYPEYLKPVYEEAKKYSHEVKTAAEFIGLEPQLLEARRKELHKLEPVPREVYREIEKGKL